MDHSKRLGLVRGSAVAAPWIVCRCDSRRTVGGSASGRRRPRLVGPNARIGLPFLPLLRSRPKCRCNGAVDAAYNRGGAPLAKRKALDPFGERLSMVRSGTREERPWANHCTPCMREGQLFKRAIEAISYFDSMSIVGRRRTSLVCISSGAVAVTIFASHAAWAFLVTLTPAVPSSRAPPGRGAEPPGAACRRRRGSSPPPAGRSPRSAGRWW